MRIVFAGTPGFAATILEALLDSRHTVVAVYTQPDRRAGRGRRLKPSPVKALAAAHGLPLRQPPSLKSHGAVEALAECAPDVMAVAAYGLLLPPALLSVPRFGCVNVHASLLPRWRGAAPVQRAILAGDTRTGVSIMQMDAGLDTGAVFDTRAVDILQEDTAASLTARLATLGAEALLETLNALENGTVKAAPQDDRLATYAPRVEKHEARLDWSEDASSLARRVRAMNPWPVAFTWLPGHGREAERRLRVWQAHARVDEAPGAPPGQVLRSGAEGIAVATGRGILWLTEVQVPGSRVMPAADFLNARTLKPGAVLGDA